MYFILLVYSCAGSLLLPGPHLMAAGRGCPLVEVRGLLIAVAFLAVEPGL